MEINNLKQKNLHSKTGHLKNPKSCIIFFIKALVKGHVKTRLAKTFGSKTVLIIYQNFVKDMLNMLRCLDYELRVYFNHPDLMMPAKYLSSDMSDKKKQIKILQKEDEIKKEIQAFIGNDLKLFVQKGRNLGEKMHNAFKQTFDKGFSKALLIGSDIPDLPSYIIENAFLKLQNFQSVIGHCSDGGYYLIGFNSKDLSDKVFEDIKWGSDNVFFQTKKRFNDNNINFAALDLWYDIDTKKDLIEFIKRNKNKEFTTIHYLKQLNLIERIL